MRRAIIVGVAILHLAGGAAIAQPAPAAPAGHQAGEEAAVLAVFDRFLQAVSARDVETITRLQTADGMTYVARPVDGKGVQIVARPNAYWADPARAHGPPLRERYWSPTVLVRGRIAVVWAPYEFWQDGKTSHCGVDVFSFVNVEGAWRVSNAMWTVEPDACPALRPGDASQLRPRD